MDISERQQKLLLTIIKEFIETAEAVGSISLQNKYNFRVSPATIRNEMAELVGQGYLFQKNSSGGRIPTTKGWRYFIESLDSENLRDLDDATKERIHNELVQIKSENSMLVRTAMHHLSQLANNAAVALLEHDIYYAGLAQMVALPEFREAEKLRNVLALLEDYYTLSDILNKGNPDSDINILIGEETEVSDFADYAVIFSELRVRGAKKGYIAVIGPNRMRYDYIIPAVRYLSETIKTFF